jgi:hypothetical protein
MNLELHPDWQRILFHSWSVRLQLMVGFFAAAQAGMTYAADGHPGWALAICGSTLATTVARVVKQAAVSGPAEDGDDE